MNLQELLQKKAALVAKQRALYDTARAENRELTDAEIKDFDAHDKEIEQLQAQIATVEAQAERERKLAAREQELNQPGDQPYRPNYAGPGAPSQNNQKKDDAGFTNLGEFVFAVRFQDPKGRLTALPTNSNGGIRVPDAFADSLLPRVRNEWEMDTGAGGGFAVPKQTSSTMLSIDPEEAIVRPRALVLPAGEPPDAELTIPAYQQGSKGVYGGVSVYWTGDGQQVPPTGGALREISLTPRELMGDTEVRDKLLRNWAAASSFITFMLRGASTSAQELAFLNGDGVAKPLGALKGKGVLKVNRKVANQIDYSDAAAMLAKLAPQAKSGAVWVATQDTMPQIVTMKDGAGRFVFVGGDVSRGIPDTLSGLPIRWTGKTSALGTTGDLSLVNFAFYAIKDGSGPFIAASEHVLFRQNKTVIKIFMNVDGKGWVDEPLTLENGVTQVSPYVVLDVPAV